MKLTRSMKERLLAASKGKDTVGSGSITHPTYLALESRGLVCWATNRSRPWGGEWQITDAGRAILAAEKESKE